MKPYLWELKFNPSDTIVDKGIVMAEDGYCAQEFITEKLNSRKHILDSHTLVVYETFNSHTD